MPGPGRNQPCPCGSSRKTKHCCSQRNAARLRTNSRAPMSPTLTHQAIPDLDGLSDRALHHLSERLMDLPAARSVATGHPPKADRPRHRTPTRSDRTRPPRLGLGRAHKRAQADRHPPTTSTTRRRDHPTPRPNRIGRRQAAYALLDLHTPSGDSSPPACSSRRRPASFTAPQAASESPPDPDHLSGGSS